MESMSKILLIMSVILIIVGVIMYLVDFLPIDMFSSKEEGVYYKIVATDSFSILSYRLHVLVVGLTLFVLLKLAAALGV